MRWEWRRRSKGSGNREAEVEEVDEVGMEKHRWKGKWMRVDAGSCRPVAVVVDHH